MKLWKGIEGEQVRKGGNNGVGKKEGVRKEQSSDGIQCVEL